MIKKKHHIKYIHESQYVAEVEVELCDSGEGWSPYLSVEDAQKLDEVKQALKRDDLVSACRLAKVFRLMPVAA